MLLYLLDELRLVGSKVNDEIDTLASCARMEVTVSRITVKSVAGLL